MSEAFRLLATRKFNGAIIDYGLHNEAFDFCMELRERGDPLHFREHAAYLQAEGARRADARHVTGRLAHVMTAAQPEPGAFIAAPRAHPDPSLRVSHS